ncbi:hypothetical protein V8G54_009195 [Vigna mungo]|uniref:Uncharacterized protein n=1 Tax=Vigna mungo TaxID=3915 RepID=A0AAQ3NVC3_VIGMU
MVQWQRHIFPFLRHIHKRVVDHHHANPSAPSLVISRLASSLSQGQIGRRAWTITTPTLPYFSRPIFLGFQHQFCGHPVAVFIPSERETEVGHVMRGYMSFAVISGGETMFLVANILGMS